MAVKTDAALTTTLTTNITDALGKQNTAARVREIIQDIIDSKTNLSSLGVIGNTIYVDSVNGNNSTGEVENPFKPFLTIAAAHSAGAAYYTGGTAPSSTNIITMILSGEFTETVAIKSYYNYDINKANVYGVWTDTGTNAACVCKVYGKGQMAASSTNVLDVVYGTNMIIDVDVITGKILTGHANDNLFIRARSITASGHGIIQQSEGTINIYDAALSNTGAVLCQMATVGTVRFYNCTLLSTHEIMTNPTGTSTAVCTFGDCRLKTTGTNYDAINLQTNAGTNLTLTLRNCTVIANGTGNSIDAAQATNVYIYGTCQVNLTHDTGNVTLLVGTVANGRFIVSTDVL